MKTTSQKRTNAIPYTSDQEVLIPADTGQSFAISARDWSKLRSKTESLSPAATKWELAFSVSVSVLISFFISALSTLGQASLSVIGGIYWLITAFSLGVSIVTFIGMKQHKTTFKSEKEDLLNDMNEIQGMYSQAASNNDKNDSVPKSSLNTWLYGANDSANHAEYDELYNTAKMVALEKGTVSTSFLQRKLRIGYARAARIVEQMEKEGFAAQADGAKPRALLQKDIQ